MGGDVYFFLSCIKRRGVGFRGENIFFTLGLSLRIWESGRTLEFPPPSCNSIGEVFSITIQSSIEILERRTLRYLN